MPGKRFAFELKQLGEMKIKVWFVRGFELYFLSVEKFEFNIERK